MRHFLPLTAVGALLALTACELSEPSEDDLRTLFEDTARKGASFMGVRDASRYMPTSFDKSGCSAAGENRYDCAITAAFADGSTVSHTMTVAKAGDAFRLEKLR